MWNALLGKEWVNVYIQWKCVETLYIFTSILLNHPEHSSAKKLCINILQYNSWLGNWQTTLCMRYTVSFFTFSKISMVKHFQVYATSRKVVFSFKRALFLQIFLYLGIICGAFICHSTQVPRRMNWKASSHIQIWKSEALNMTNWHVLAVFLKVCLDLKQMQPGILIQLQMKKYSLSDPQKTDTFLPENLAACRLTEDVKDYSSKAKRRRETGIWHQRNYCLSIRGMAMNQSYWALKAIPLYKLCSESYQTSQPLPLWVLSLCHT